MRFLERVFQFVAEIFAPVKSAVAEVFGPFLFVGPVISTNAEDFDTLARTLWGEARSEGRQGMQAVANVIINRHRLRASGAGYPSFGRVRASVAEICKAPWQFSAWNAGDPNLPLLLRVNDTDVSFRQAQDVASQALRGSLPDITGGADHYHTKAVTPPWSSGIVPIVTIGAHRFYKLIAAPRASA